jgi:hypothetical protein
MHASFLSVSLLVFIGCFSGAGLGWIPALAVACAADLLLWLGYYAYVFEVDKNQRAAKSRSAAGGSLRRAISWAVSLLL